MSHYLSLLHTIVLSFTTPSCLAHYVSSLDGSTFETSGKLSVPPTKSFATVSSRKVSQTFAKSRRYFYIFLSKCSCFTLILYMVPFVIHKDRDSLQLRTFIKFVAKVIWVKGYFKLFFSLSDSFYFGYNFLNRFYYPSSINYLLEFICSEVSQYSGTKFCCYSNLFLLNTSAASVTSCS